MSNEEPRSTEERLEALEQEQLAPLHGVTKEAVKEALKEWLDEQFARVGKWTVHGILAVALAALVYFILVHNGWRQT